MLVQILLGAGVGILVSLVSWIGNKTHSGISVLPNGLTALLLLILTSWAVWSCARQLPDLNPRMVWKIGSTITLATSLFLGTGMVFIGRGQLHHPTPTYLTFSFILGFGTALLCGAVVSLVMRHILVRGSVTKVD